MKPVVMVVDDDAAILDLLSTLLKKYGYLPITSSNGAAALETLKHSPIPDLIITDYCMPILNGCEFVENIAHHPMFKDIPVFMMTGSVIDDLEIPITNNFKGFIEKPFSMDTILGIARYATSENLYCTASCLA